MDLVIRKECKKYFMMNSQNSNHDHSDALFNLAITVFLISDQSKQTQLVGMELLERRTIAGKNTYFNTISSQNT